MQNNPASARRVARLHDRYLNTKWWSEVVRGRARRFVKRFGFKPHVIEKTIEGEAFLFFLADSDALAWYGFAEHQNAELRLARDHMLKPGMRVLELGGHHGHDTLPLSRWVGPDGRVVTVEPLPRNVGAIEENLRLNGVANVTVVAAAAGSAGGEGHLKDTSNGSIAGPGGVPIAIRTVDEICAAHDFAPDYIKMDIEGFEVDAMMGAKAALARRPHLHIELHVHALPKYQRTVAEFWSLFDHASYELWLQTDDLEAPSRIPGPVEPPHRSHVFAIPR